MKNISTKTSKVKFHDGDADKITEIISHPTTINNIHESVYRCYHILEFVKSYLSTHQGNEFILIILDFLQSHGQKKEVIK